MDTGYIAGQMGYWLLPVLLPLMSIMSIRRRGVHKAVLIFAIFMGFTSFAGNYWTYNDLVGGINGFLFL